MKPITATPTSATIFTKACIVLHNFLTERDPRCAHENGDYFKEGRGIADDQWRQDATFKDHYTFADLSAKSGQNS